MKKYNLTGYQNIFKNTCEINSWKPTVESDDDKKLVEALFNGQSPNIPSARKMMPMTSLVYIMFGKASLDQLLTTGLTD